jgi:hypothetical protein
MFMGYSNIFYLLFLPSGLGHCPGCHRQHQKECRQHHHSLKIRKAQGFAQRLKSQYNSLYNIIFSTFLPKMPIFGTCSFILHGLFEEMKKLIWEF